MDFLNLHNLWFGFGVAVSPINLLYCFFGVFLGTFIGVLPGIGPVATIAMLLPATFYLPAVPALIMLAGIFYGAEYGGSTTSILVNIPGESGSVVTCLDGYAMARQGRAGPALAISAIGSFFAGCVATVIIALFAPPLAAVALNFRTPDYFSLMVFGLVSAGALAQGSLVKAFAMVVIGLLLGLVGTDASSGTVRFTFGITQLYDGISFVAVAMGLFGFSEIIFNLEVKEKREVFTTRIQGLMPTWTDFKASWKAICRGTVLGSVIGILPGAGAIIPPFASYALEKKLSSDPSRFGKGAIEGVAGPESANNAGAQTSFIPLLTMGIPSNSIMALMIAAMMIHGIVPGPDMITKQPALFWGMITSMWIGNLMLVILNLPLICIWVRLLTVPYRFLFPAILMFCSIGAYSVNNSIMDVMFVSGFGLLGYILRKLACEPAPLILGFILGPMMEENFRRAMLLSHGNPAIFLTQPVSLGLLVAAALLLLIVVFPKGRRQREIREE